MTITREENQILNHIDLHAPALLELLEKLVNTDSFSTDKKGVDRAGDVLSEFYASYGISIEARRNVTYGDALIARIGNGGKPILLMGHRDTVFPTGEAASRPYTTRNGMAFGPGVNDMKAGLGVNAAVMAAFRACLDEPPAIWSLMTGDEELASPFSRSVIEELAAGARVVFNAEPARASGNVVTARKGGRFMALEVKGKPAHSGVNFFDGSSAINEIASKIVRMAEITDESTGTTLNVGLISGGQTVNTVAPWARCEIDLRFTTPETCAKAIEQIEQIVADCRTPSTTAELTIKGEFVPMVPNDGSMELFDLYRNAAADLGIRLDGEFTGACADSGFASALGVPTLCGVGPVGDKSHTPDEFIRLDTLLERTKVLALAISRVATGNS